MGIPIGWNIPREDATKKDVLHADVTGQRSPIRRRRTGRTTSPTSQSAVDAGFFVSSHAERVARRSRTSRPSYTSLSQQRVAPPPVPEVSRPAYDLSRDPPRLQREDARIRRMQLRMDARAIRAIDAAISDGDISLPELTTGFAPAAASREADEDARHSNPYARSNDNRTTVIVDPDAGVTLQRHGRDGVWRPLDPRSEHPALRGGNNEDNHETSDSNAVLFSPLRRMGRRNVADGPLASSSLRISHSPVPTWDGLGDRQRSFSPSGESSQWDTFYGTIVPDNVAPTAESSFASAAASASFSNSHPSSRASSSNTSASSSHTHLTVPSQRQSPTANEQFMRACDTSDDDTASDTEAEEDTAPTAEVIRHRYNPYYFGRRSRPSYFSDEPPNRDTERHSRRVTERTQAASAYVRSYYRPNAQRRDADGDAGSAQRSPRMRMGQLDGPTDGPLSASDDELPPLVSPDSSNLDQELREARSLLERLSRRVDITDDFWASVGLTRSFADRVESFNERERL